MREGVRYQPGYGRDRPDQGPERLASPARVLEIRGVVEQWPPGLRAGATELQEPHTGCNGSS